MNKKVTIGQILTVIVSLIIGMLSIFVIQNYLVAEKIEFNTLGLLGFVLSILFGGASIVLAFTAINLGKSSEQMMIERSEKSIELQNEVYIKTTEALKKIESSTGVTEKRIEDIIAGRVGDIASRLVDDKIVTGKDKDKLEHELRRSVILPKNRTTG
jgi:regulator of protease activity HflC (stomatin/prohibitin superfamily)